MPQDQLSRLLNCEELAEILNVPISWVQRAVCENRIPFMKISHKVLHFHPDEIQRWLETTKISPQKDETHEKQ